MRIVVTPPRSCHRGQQVLDQPVGIAMHYPSSQLSCGWMTHPSCGSHDQSHDVTQSQYNMVVLYSTDPHPPPTIKGTRQNTATKEHHRNIFCNEKYRI